ncbi:type II toxin-antitoxin system VapC family toxin [Polaromonas sp.]|uniref:type II toxin-antitoxin system VapC family toxin n=1 Tax=Polaromonas sp. TaxID=1869339 RepID=UPI003267CADE
MYLLDTNVLSELMRPTPSPQVLQWMDAQAAQSLYTSAITRAEIELGLALLPKSKRHQALSTQSKAMFEEDFSGRCLAFDESCAPIYGVLVAARTRQGRPISVEDAQIAAVCLAHQKTLVTRNTADFENIEALRMINPWTVSGAA